mmetsp:Transcript_34968/g.79307  ORF Transcript_34968/g.79307 Transcript_34968/m.79307 type:complete len:87 (+) Transcript_34968:573-833(+)
MVACTNRGMRRRAPTAHNTTRTIGVAQWRNRSTIDVRHNNEREKSADMRYTAYTATVAQPTESPHSMTHTSHGTETHGTDTHGRTQ